MNPRWGLLLTGATLVAFVFSARYCPADAQSLTLFGISASIYLATILLASSSVVNVTFGSFLIVGFYLKFIAHFGGSSALIEPTGLFDDSPRQWSVALTYSSVGLLGAAAATLICSRFPSLGMTRDATFSGRAMPTLRILFWLALVASLVVYGLNLKWNILRIGYPIAVTLPNPLYPLLAFTITWGALFAVAALVCWTIALRPRRIATTIYVAACLGFAASFTMGSRVQLLLYVLAGTVIVIWRAGFRGLFAPRVLASFAFAVALFGLSIATVSLQRNLDFTNPELRAAPDAKRTEDPAEKKDSPYGDNRIARPPAVPGDSPGRMATILIELKSLAIMRWVGLEGVMTAVGTREPLGTDLMLRMVREDPALGHNGTYQHLAGDIYAEVTTFTFLTLPGPIGIAAFSGSYLIVAAVSFLLVMLGHTLEWFAARLTRNIGCVAVTGVSLAYLFVQMCFPRTLLVYMVELGAAIVAMGALGWLLARLFPVKERSSALS